MTALRLVPPPCPSSPATIALRAFVWLVRDSRWHPELADVRLRTAFCVLEYRIRLEASR